MSDFVYRCKTCRHAGAETEGDVSCCNVCGETFDIDGEQFTYDLYEAEDGEEEA